ncbi:hypothetical protein AB0F46_35340 [Streptomyces sp. NPDC026665]|uniref:hypothetical protein n=1 Tax=Streptomyces sp. NPDC026665 TaxID=3154798 RepID=UPI0034022E53
MADPVARQRRRELLEAIRRQPTGWSTGQVQRFYQDNNWGHDRNVARYDLRHLAESGLLLASGPANNRVYHLNLARDARFGHGWQTPLSTPNRVKRRTRRR